MLKEITVLKESEEKCVKIRVDMRFPKTEKVSIIKPFILYSDTEQYVTNGAFTLLQRMGDKIVAAGEILGADAVYETALKYAQSEAERNLISSKRSVIASRVSILKKKKRRKEKFEQLKANVSDIFESVFEKALIVLFIISVLATPLFGVLTLLGLFTAFSKVAFIVSLCILSLFLIMFAIVAIQDKLT